MTDILTSRGAQCAIRNPRKARPCCNPPQSAIRHAKNATSPEAFESGIAPTQERPQNGSRKLPR
eukprot:6848949-Alexandrium_andersonii.AAC.1